MIHAALTLALPLLMAAAPLERGVRRSVQQVRSFTTLIQASGDLADVYYPAPPLGLQPAFVDRLPVVALLQGALVDKRFYSEYARHVAASGFVVVVPNHVRTLRGRPELFTEMTVIDDVLDEMRSHDADPSSPLYQLTDTERLAVLGHSFGGAAALFALDDRCRIPFCDPGDTFERPDELEAVVVFGAHTVSAGTGAPADVDSSGVPVALLVGEFDSGGTPQRVERTFEILETPRALMNFRGINHFGITNENNPPGANPDPTEPTIHQHIAIRRLARWTALYLQAHVLNDPVAFNRVYNAGGNANVFIRADR